MPDDDIIRGSRSEEIWILDGEGDPARSEEEDDWIQELCEKEGSDAEM